MGFLCLYLWRVITATRQYSLSRDIEGPSDKLLLQKACRASWRGYFGTERIHPQTGRFSLPIVSSTLISMKTLFLAVVLCFFRPVATAECVANR